MTSDYKAGIYGAVVSNLGIAVTKFIAGVQSK